MLLVRLLPASPSLTCPDLPKQGAILPAPWGQVFFLLGTNMTRLPRHHRTLETNPVLFSLIKDNTPSPPAAYPPSPPSSPFPAKVSLVLSVALHQRKNGRLESRAGRALPCAQGAIHVLPGEASVQREACACGQLPNPASSLLIGPGTKGNTQRWQLRAPMIRMFRPFSKTHASSRKLPRPLKKSVTGGIKPSRLFS